MDDYLPLAYLNAWEYCPRRYYLEYVLGEWAENQHIVLGNHLHRNIDEERVVAEGSKIIRQQQWVWSDRLRVKGVIDAVEESAGVLVPVEYKKGRMASHLNDHFQLCAAALCLEEQLGGSIAAGEIFYYQNRRRERVLFSAGLRRATEEAIAAAHGAVSGAMPPPLEHGRKCRDCSLLGLCLPKEVRKLRQLAMEPLILDEDE